MHLSRELDRLVGVIKSLYGLSSKDKAVQFIIREQAEEILERELRPEFAQRILSMQKHGRFRAYKSVKQLRAAIEHV